LRLCPRSPGRASRAVDREFFPGGAGHLPIANAKADGVHAPMNLRRHLLVAAAMPVWIPVVAQAQTPPTATEEITVVGASPLIGGGVNRNLIPAETQLLGEAQISRNGAPDALAALSANVAGLNLDSAAGNPYQPSLFYNGFETSPLQGTSQGIAVYLNGIRFNSPFGDTVNFDLIPDVAIAHVNVEGANPVFGLNALGGAINIALKNGFTYQGGEADISGGSFGQIQADVQYGMQSGDEAIYAAASERHEGGWRDLQSSDIQNFYGDYGVRHDGSEFHVNLTLANSSLNGPGTSPVQLLAADPAAQFTAPNLVANKYVQFGSSANIHLSDTLSVQAVAYYNYFQQRVANGNTANDFPCDNGTGLMCQSPGVPSTTTGGAYIPDFLHGGPYSELDMQDTNTNAYGASAQVSEAAELYGHANNLTAGASFDGAKTTFTGEGLLGGLTLDSREYYGPGVVLDEPGVNTPVRAAITDGYGGVFATDTFNLTKGLAVTVSGRYNMAEVNLLDEHGGDLTGNHAYNRFNPALGLTWHPVRFLTAYASYSEANRAPTPAELSCAGPQNSCSLANFFVGDPDLKQVVARTVEGGLRGHYPVTTEVSLGYDLSLFRTDSDDDIQFINSARLGRAYFANVGMTRRQGVSARLDATSDNITAYASYTYTEATFQSGFVESAGSNPDADANGDITIMPGDTLPGVPRTVVKAGIDDQLTDKIGQFLFGDEANLTPRLPGFFTLNLHGSYQLTPHVQLFTDIQNATDARYYTYGTFSPTSQVYLEQAPGASNPRAYSPGAPIGVFGGVKVTF
jgi:outer membrane receptor protein involved in Fe transport